MQKFRRIVRKRKTELTAACLLLLLSLAMAFAGSWFYRQYRKQVIQTEESQLLTMAGIIGNNLNTYLDEQLKQIDLFYAQEADSENNMPPEDIETRTAYFLKENGGLYNWITVTESDGTSLRYEPGKEAVREQAEEAIRQGKNQLPDQPSRIFGKAISGQTGWYELYIRKEVPSENGICILTFAMNLETIYQKIIAPVKIGRDGYSSVKDQNMCIIMHHAKDQIGLEAFDDRMKKYPELDLSSMNAWIKKQAQDTSGTGVIDTYVWDDPGLSRVQRVVHSSPFTFRESAGSSIPRFRCRNFPGRWTV